MIAKLCAKDLLQKSHLAELEGKPEISDEYLRLAVMAIHCSKSNKQRRIFSQITPPVADPNYIEQQRGSDEAVSAATMAWTEYFTNLFSRLPSASGPDAYAIAEYARDVQKKIAGISNLAAQEEKEGRNNMQQFNLKRRVSPLGSDSAMSSAGQGFAYKGMPGRGQYGMGQAGLRGVIAPAQQAWETGRRGVQEAWQLPGVASRAMGTSAPGTQSYGNDERMFTYAPQGKPIVGPYQEHSKATGKQNLTLNNYLQGSPFLVTTEQIMGTGRGKYEMTRASEMYANHPALKDPAANQKGFAAMEKCWIEYYYKYLPSYGIVGGKASGGSGVPSAFAGNKNTIKTAQAGATLPPVPSLAPPGGAPDWPTAVKNRSKIGAKTNPNIAAEKEFFTNIFVEVEKRMAGEGEEGATLKGIVKKGAISYLTGDVMRQEQAAEIGGSMAGGVAGLGAGAMGLVNPMSN